jgi:hypothetical protein
MTGPEAIQLALKSTQSFMPMYLNDLTDADLLVRPVPGANHIAWQLGHLIVGEVFLAKDDLPGAKYPALPAGFAEQYTKETSGSDSPKGVLSKAQYLELFNAARTATIAAVAQLTPADLDKPTKGSMAKFAPRLGDLLQLMANHTLMHAGQFTAVRRKLGKPVVF